MRLFISKILIFIVLWGWFSSCQQQVADAPTRAFSSKTDSLLQVLENKPISDIERVNLLNELAWMMKLDSVEASQEYAAQALQLSEKIDFKIGKADALNRLGICAEIRDEVPVAIQYYNQSVDIRKQLGDISGVISIYNNLGTLYDDAGVFDSAIFYFNQCLKIAEDHNDSTKIYRAHFNIAQLYEASGFFEEAVSHTQEFRDFAEIKKDSITIAMGYKLMGHIRFELDMYPEALKWYEKALSIRAVLKDTIELAAAYSDLANALDEMKSSEKAIENLLIALSLYRNKGHVVGMAQTLNNLGDAHKHLKNYQQALVYLREAESILIEDENYQALLDVWNTMGDVYYGMKDYPAAMEYVKKYADISTELNDKKYIQKSLKDLAKLYAAQQNWSMAYVYRLRYDSVYEERMNEKRIRSFAQKETLYSDRKISRQNEQQKAQLEINKQTKNALMAGAAALSLFVLLLYNRNRLRAKANRALAQKNEIIEAERQRADNLLMNILPASTAEELKKNNAVRPEKYDAVTVMFTDFKSFTTIAEKMQPEDLVQELDDCFRLFDHITEKYGIEKIKTIGDAYMCAGGLPIRSEHHAIAVVGAALEMQEALKKMAAQKLSAGLPFFEMRVGIHTGPVVAGVVGAKKFAYDIWGDTVNTAARMEAGSNPGRVNISETTFELVKDHFSCTYRGKLPAKNKGEIAMYFVEAAVSVTN